MEGRKRTRRGQEDEEEDKKKEHEVRGEKANSSVVLPTFLGHVFLYLSSHSIVTKNTDTLAPKVLFSFIPEGNWNTRRNKTTSHLTQLASLRQLVFTYLENKNDPMAYVFEVSKYSQSSFPTDHDMCLEQPNIFTELCRCDQSHVHFST